LRSPSTCLEFAAVRDSKRPEGGAHVVDRNAFARFLKDVQGGRYDI